MTSIFVAGASAELERCEAAIAGVRKAGFEVSYDWPAGIRARAKEGLTDADLTAGEMLRYVKANLDALEASKVFWLLVPYAPTSGAWFEFGYVELLRRVRNPRRSHIVVSGPYDRYMYCATCAQRMFKTDQAALLWLENTYEGA